jgi:hypothetical protein
MTTDYTTLQDQKFRDAWKTQASGSNAKDFGKDWPTRNTFNEKLDYVKRYYTSADTKNKDLALKLGTEWLQSNLPKGLLKADGTPYEIADYQNIILPNKTVQGTATKALHNAMFSAAKDIVNGTNTTKQSSQLVELAAGDLIGAGASSSYNPNAFIKGFTTVVAPTLVTPSGSLADIKKQYGSLYDKSGKPLFSDTELKNVYNGSLDALQSFRSKLNTVVEDAVKATDPSFAKEGSTQGSAYVTARNKLLSDPAGTLAQNYNTNVSGLKTSDKGGWVTSSGTVVGGPVSTDTVVGGPVSTGNGITGLLPKGSYKDVNGNFAYTGGQIDSKDMTDFTQSYNPNKGVYRAPTMDASNNLVSNPTSPYSNILNGMLSNYKDPFASGYTSSLDSMQPAAMTSTQLASLSKPFTTNATASDLVKLANSAGGEYDPTNKAGSTLPPALHQLYQNQTLPDGTVKAKPGVPDPTKMKVPGANFLDLNGDLLYGDIAGGDLTNTPMGGDAKTAGESASGFTPDTTLKDVPGATITDESGTLTKPDITDKATADALHKAEQDRIAKEAADKAEADKKALYYNADGTLTRLGFYTYNPTGNYQDYLNQIAADKDPVDTDRGPLEPIIDPKRPPVDTDRGPLEPIIDPKRPPVDTDRGPLEPIIDPKRPPVDTGGITSLVDNPTYSFTEGDYVEPSTRARKDLQARAATDPKLAAQLAWSATQDAARGYNANPTYSFIADEYMEPSTRARADIQAKAATDPKLAAQLAWSATQDAARGYNANPTYSFIADEYMEPSTRARADIQAKAATDPKLAAQLTWSATQDAARGQNANPTYSFIADEYMEPSTRARADIQAKAATDPKLAAQLTWSATQDAKYAPSTPTGTPLTGIASTQAAKNTIADVSSSAIKSPIGNLLSSQNTLNTAPGITTLKGSPDITTQSLTAPPANAKPLDPYTTMGATGKSAVPTGVGINTLVGSPANAKSLDPYTTMDATGKSPESAQPQQAVANEPTNDWGVPYSQLRAGSPAKSAATNPVVATPYYSNYD